MISITKINELRKKSGAGVADCKNCLTETNGDVAAAIVLLRKKGLADINIRTGKATKEGIVGHYIHMGGKIGVLLEVNCETDFVSRSSDFQQFSKDVSMHIAAINPKWLNKEDVPTNIMEKEIDIIRSTMGKKPVEIEAKIIKGRLDKFFKETCLMEQAFVKNEDLLIKDLLGELVSKVGEKVVVRRFARFETGEDL